MLLLRTNGTSDACYYSKKIEATKGRDNFRKEMKPNSNPWLLIPVVQDIANNDNIMQK